MSLLKSAYSILPESNIVLEIHEGIYRTSDYIPFKKELSQDTHFAPNLNYLIDLRSTTFDVSFSDIENFSNYIKLNQKELGKRRIALLTYTPDQVVKTTMYQESTSNENNTIGIFSTEESAFNWLAPKNLSYQDFIEALSSLQVKGQLSPQIL